MFCYIVLVLESSEMSLSLGGSIVSIKRYNDSGTRLVYIYIYMLPIGVHAEPAFTSYFLKPFLSIFFPSLLPSARRAVCIRLGVYKIRRLPLRRSLHGSGAAQKVQ